MKSVNDEPRRTWTWACGNCKQESLTLAYDSRYELWLCRNCKPAPAQKRKKK